MNVEFKIKLTDSQKEAYGLLHNKDVRVLVLCMSRQIGKSVLAQIAVIESLLSPKKISAYISPTHTLSRKVFKDIVRLLEPTGTLLKANASNLVIETIFGSELRFFSAESPNSIRGQTFSGIVVLDEFAFFPTYLPTGEEIYSNIILPTAKARKPKILILSTPRGKENKFYELYLNAKNKEKGYAYLHKTIYDDNLVTKEQIEELKRNMPELAWRQEFLTEFLDSSLTFFNGFEKCFKPIKHSYKKTWIGVDLSGDGKDETILTKINELNEVEQYIIEGTLDIKYKRIADIINQSTNLQGCLIEINGLGSPMYNEIRKLVKHKQKLNEWTTTNSSKNEIVSNLAVEIANEDISFNKEDTQLFSQFGTFIVNFTKSGNMTFSAQDGKKDDRIMSLAIALQCKKSIRPFNKNNFGFIQTTVKDYL